MLFFTIGNVIAYIMMVYILKLAIKYKRQAEAVNKYRFEGENKKLTDMMIMDNPMAEIKLCDSFVLLDMFSVRDYQTFYEDYYSLLKYFKMMDFPIEFLVNENVKIDAKLINDVSSMLVNKEALKRVVSIIDKYVLKNAKRNPNKLTIDKVAQYMAPIQFLDIFTKLKEINVDCVKKKVGLLLEQITGHKTLDTYAKSILKNTDGQENSFLTPSYPSYSLWAEEEGKTITTHNGQN